MIINFLHNWWVLILIILLPGILYIEPVATSLGFVVVSIMCLGGFFMCYTILEGWIINSRKKDKDQNEKFNLSSLAGFIFYFLLDAISPGLLGQNSQNSHFQTLY